MATLEQMEEIDKGMKAAFTQLGTNRHDVQPIYLDYNRMMNRVHGICASENHRPGASLKEITSVPPTTELQPFTAKAFDAIVQWANEKIQSLPPPTPAKKRTRHLLS